jgi:Putative DNA-binding domain
MREPWQWQTEDIQALIREQRQEDLRLEYKRSDALAKTDPKKKEITKDVSAMANSAGGAIIYGINEQKPSGPIQLDGGTDPNEISKEWLEQVIDSGVQRRIDGVIVLPVAKEGSGRAVYVVWVPQSSRAPHMASDHRYYKRLGTTTAMMEEYEVRDVSRRSESPDLYLDLRVWEAGPTGIVCLEPRIGNRSSEPVLYATCRLYIDLSLHFKMHPSWRWSVLADTELIWHNKEKMGFHALHQPWSVPERHPILEGEQYPMDPIQVDIGSDFRRALELQRYKIGWELRAPRAVPKLQGLKLEVGETGPRIAKPTFTLAPL